MTAQAKILEKTVAEPTTTATATSGFGFLGMAGAVGILAAIVTMSLNPPKSHMEMAGMWSAAFGSSVTIGPLMIDWFSLHDLTLQGQLGVCFVCGSLGWLAISIATAIGRKWRDSKNPLGAIAKDVGSARKGLK